LNFFDFLKITVFAKASAVYPGISSYVDNYFHIKLSYNEDITNSFWYDPCNLRPTI